jgi:hypothetical protein
MKMKIKRKRKSQIRISEAPVGSGISRMRTKKVA